MLFEKVRTRNIDKGKRAYIWIPRGMPNYHADQHYNQPVEAEIEGARRLLDSGVMSMLAEFTRTYSRRMHLGHDAVVFALACEAGKEYRNVHFNTPGGVVARVGKLDYPDPRDTLKVPDLKSGGIIFTSNDSTMELPLGDTRPHFMVKANTDDGAPLYASKLGRSGPVALARVADLAGFYDIQVVGRASHFFTVPFNE